MPGDGDLRVSAGSRTVSVVIPTYNRGRWLPLAVASAWAQSVRPLEVIVVDDGSTDETERVARGLGEGVRYLRQANAGVAAARNTGIAAAQGECVAFLDSDDEWRPAKLEAQLAALRAAPEAEWSLTGCDVIDFAGAVVPGSGIGTVFPAFHRAGMAPDAFLARWLARRPLEVGLRSLALYVGDAFAPLFFGNLGLPSSALVSRGLLERAGGFDPAFRLAEETEFFHRLAAHAPVAYLTEPLVGYRTSQDGSLISPANVGTLIENALSSLERARALRPADAAAEEPYRLGRRALLAELAYARLSRLDGRGARQALRQAWAEGAARTPRSLAVYAASLAPARALRLLHALKRRAGA